MSMLHKVFHCFIGQTVTVFVDGGPAVTAMVLEADHCSVILVATSGSNIFIPFNRITAVQGYPLSFPALPA